MDNAAVRVCEGPDVVEEVVTVENEVKEMVPDVAVFQNRRDEALDSNRRWFCGCCSKRQNENRSLEPAGSSALYAGAAEFTEIQSSRSFCQEMRYFLNSPVYYVFVTIVTFLITIVLLAELFVDIGLLRSRSTASDTTNSFKAVSETDAAMENVSITLHWFSFGLLAIFFIEVILRIAVWRLRLIKDYISIFDIIVVLIAFLSDLCVTLTVGPESVIDGISLVIVLRLVRIHSLITVKVEAVKKKCDRQIKDLENELHTANCTLSRLRRQVKEKDYEIKQLQAYLGGQVSTEDARLFEAFETGLRNQDTKGATADTALQIAIALSKQSFNETNDGIINKAFSYPKGQDEDLAVLVHQRPDRLNSQESDIEPVAKATSYMDEYFSQQMEGEQNGTLSSNPSSGAIPKKKNFSLPLRANSNSNNNSNGLYAYESALKVLQTDEPFKEPITVCVDPTILQCDDSTPTETYSSKWLDDSSGHEPTEEGRSTFSSPASDIGSSDECALDAGNPACHPPKKTQASVFKSFTKKSGSSISSESGYISEDGNGKKRTTLSTVNATVSDTDRETSAL